MKIRFFLCLLIVGNTCARENDFTVDYSKYIDWYSWNRRLAPGYGSIIDVHLDQRALSFITTRLDMLTLKQLVYASGMNAEYLSSSVTTFFAPVDNAFLKLVPTEFSRMLRNPHQVRRMLYHYIVPGLINLRTIALGQERAFKALSGAQLVIKRVGKDRLIINDRAVIISVVDVDNGEVIIIDSLL